MRDRGNDEVEVEVCVGKYGSMAGNAVSTTKLQLTCHGKRVALCSWLLSLVSWRPRPHPSPPTADRRRTPESRIRTGSRSASKRRRAAGAGTQGERESKFRVGCRGLAVASSKIRPASDSVLVLFGSLAAASPRRIPLPPSEPSRRGRSAIRPLKELWGSSLDGVSWAGGSLGAAAATLRARAEREARTRRASRGRGAVRSRRWWCGRGEARPAAAPPPPSPWRCGKEGSAPPSPLSSGGEDDRGKQGARGRRNGR
jgi:hypothetical protein